MLQKWKCTWLKDGAAVHLNSKILLKDFWGLNIKAETQASWRSSCEPTVASWASSCRITGGNNTNLWMDAPRLTLHWKGLTKHVSLWFYLSHRFFLRRGNTLLSIEKNQARESPSWERDAAATVAKPTAFNKNLRAAASLQVIFFNLNLPYTYLFMLKLSTACKIFIKKLTFN